MINKVTSLFDLFNKARTNKAYEQLTIIAAKAITDKYDYIESFEKARITLERIQYQTGEDDCQWIINRINEYRYRINEYRYRIIDEPIVSISKNREVLDVERESLRFSGENLRFYERNETNELRYRSMLTQTPIVVSSQQRNPYMNDYDQPIGVEECTPETPCSLCRSEMAINENDYPWAPIDNVYDDFGPTLSS